MRPLYLSLFWLLGIASAPALNVPWVFLFLPLPPIFLFLLKRNRTGLFISLCLLSLLGGIIRGGLDREGVKLDAFQGKEIEIVGEVASEPVHTGRGQRLILHVKNIMLGDRSERAIGQVLVLLPSFPEYSFGDRLWLRGKLEPAKGLSGVMFYPKSDLISRGEGPKLLGKLFSLRERLSLSLKQTLPEPQGSLARALLLGFREDIPKGLKEAFSQTGTSHILAISGLHIGILLGILLGLGVWAFGREKPYYLLPALLGIWLYSLLSGFRPPTVRASIMGSLFLAAEYLGRPKAGLIALSLTAVIMTALNPLILSDISFQMSFLAMAGLTIFSPLLRRLASKLPMPSYLIDSISYCVGALLGVFPLIAYYFRILSLVSVPATILAMPVLPAVILLSAATALSGLLNQLLAYPFSLLDWIFLSYLIGLVKFFSSLPGAFLKLNPLPTFLLWIYYGAMFLPAFLPRQVKRAKALARLFLSPKLSWGLLVAAFIIWATFLSLPTNKLSITFFDVGNGDAILIQKGIRQILIDGGPDPLKLSLELPKKLPIFDRMIDLVVLTHPDADHLRGLLEVLERYKVCQAIESGWHSDKILYQEWQRRLEEKGIPVIYARAGQQIILTPDIKLKVLHPQQNFLKNTEDDEDNNSVVLRLEYGKISFLFTGDLRVEGERELILRRADLKSTVLKVAHHGSSTSSSWEFLKVVSPQICVISASGRGLPSPEVVERLKEIVGERLYLTSERGTIQLISDGQRIWLKTGR